MIKGDFMKREVSKYTTWQNVVYVIQGAWKYDKKVFGYFGVYTFLASIQPFILIFFPKWILEELLGAKRLEQLVALLVSFFLVAAVVGFFTTWLRSLYFPHMIKIRFEFIRKHQKKCMMTNFKNTEDSDFLNDMETAFRCLGSNDIGIEGMLHKLFALVGNLIALGGYVTIIATLNIWVLLYLVVNVIISYFITFRVKKYEHDQKDIISENDRRSNYLYHVMYDFSYGKELRLLGIRDWIAERFVEYKNRRLTIHKKIKWKYFNVGLVDTSLLVIREVVIYSYLIYLVMNKQISIPDFTMYFTTVAGFAGWMTMMMKDLAYMRAQNLNICDYRSFIEKEEEVEQTHKMSVPEGPYTFEFRDVSFKYPNSEKYVYKHLNLIIHSGEKLAIVGHNGAGKTTFVKLLCRLYDVTDGEILLNGINIKCFDKQEYYKKFSVVFQEIKTLAFSVAENVALQEKEHINYAKVAQVLEEAGMSKKIESLKRGVHTAIQKILDDEGIELSGGENQKIAIARALYKNGEIMILDEPTAALDALAEHEIYMNFNQMVQNKIAIYISHRLASTQFCDRIAMFEQGKLVEYGTHDELMELNEKYADMFAVQAKYYQEEGA